MGAIWGVASGAFASRVAGAWAEARDAGHRGSIGVGVGGAVGLGLQEVWVGTVRGLDIGGATWLRAGRLLRGGGWPMLSVFELETFLENDYAGAETIT